MRFLRTFLLAIVILPAWLAAGDLPTVKTALPDISVTPNTSLPSVDLRNNFEITGIQGQVVQFATSLGTFNVEMNSTLAPNTVANFISYVSANSFTNSIVHRSNPFYHIIQGGSFLNDLSLTSITTQAPIAMEASDTLTNTRGTLAMARSTPLNSASSGWFINTANNSSTFLPASALDPNSYAVFGRVTGTGMTVVDSIAALPVLNGTVTVTFSSLSSAVVTVNSATLPASFGPGWGLLGSAVLSVSGNTVTLAANANQAISTSTPFPTNRLASPFDQLPVLQNLPANGAVMLTNLMTVNSIKAVPVFPITAGQPSVVTFSIASNSNPSLITTTISGSTLVLALKQNCGGFANILIKATDSNGNSAQSQFRVSVAGGNSTPRDINADAIDDLFFQNTAGSITGWRMNGAGSPASSQTIFSGNLGDWRVAAVADLNHDGIPDLIFQNTAGQLAGWLLNSSGTPVSNMIIYGNGLGDWRLVACADLNKDGIPDLIFQNTAGQIVGWLMNGSGVPTGGLTIYGGSLGDWRVVACADLNRDGIPDLVFQNTAGQLSGWLMNGSGVPTAGVTISNAALGDWKVRASADLNRDGIPDLIFQNTAGQLSGWLLNGSGTPTAGVNIYPGALGDWRLF